MLIGHWGEGIAVGAVEVDEPGFCNEFCGLGLYELQVSLANPAIDGVVGVTEPVKKSL